MSRPSWLRWADALRTIAAAGLTYSRDPFDRDRFTQVQGVAAEILASHTDLGPDRAAATLRTEPGYVTPKIDVRAAVFDPAGRILLVREVVDGRWSLPGGWADIGESPGEVAVREVREEAGLKVRATRLIALVDKARQGHPMDVWYSYKAFFACELLGGELRTSHETPEVGWFERAALPPLSLDRITPAQVDLVYRHHADPSLPAAFD